MNWRALLSQEYLSANARHASREICSASTQATRKSSFNTPIGSLPTTSFGPVTGKAATGTPLASASSCTTPNVSVRLGNTKTSAAARCAASVIVLQQAEELDAGEPPPQLRFLRARADDDFRARQIERKECFEVLFDRDPPHGDEDRAREVDRDGAVRPEQIGVHAARPHAEIAESPPVELADERRRGHHRDRRSGMKAPQRGVKPAFRDWRARRDIFGKSRRVAGGERTAEVSAIGPDHVADRSLRRDMDRIRL